MRSIEARATTSGSPAAVWELLADASKWSDWGAWSEVEIEGGGPQQPGAIRRLVRRPYTLRERVTDWVRGERMGYEIVDGMRVRGYRATVTLEPAPGGGTVVRWRSTWEKAGPFTTLMLRIAIADACRRVAKAAAR